MTKNESQPAANHVISLENRQIMKLSGVREVTAFSDSSVSLVTACGALLIQGKELNISRLNTDTGELNVNGEITVIKYSAPKRRGSVLEGLFK